MDNIQIKESFVTSMHRFGHLNLVNCFGNTLSRGEFFALGIVRRHNLEHPAGMYVSDLAQRLRVHSPAASRMLRGLEQRGLVERSICPEDRRNVSVTVTAEGVSAWQQTADKLDAFTNRVISRMGEEDMAALVTLMDRLFDIMEEEKEALSR